MVAMLEAMGVRTGVDLEKLLDVVDFVRQMVGRPLEGRVHRAARAATAEGR